ncbi:g11079 [Coccomyxa viridis]|uniref:ALA-interacting subunit n=1 Tax=Coccomyxa viridis TaxID=1274662 RepID=A0ABP1G9P2_9CHLO
MSAQTADAPLQPCKKPRYTRITQQELPACKPRLTPVVVVSVFVVIGAAFLPVGYVCLNASKSVVETAQRYDDTCIPGATTQDREAFLYQLNGDGTLCNVTLTAPRHMAAPVFLYYELDNFYQNHRRYLNSKSDAQLRGGSMATASLHSSCSPQDLLNGSSSAPIDPCGLVAWSNFNDTFQLLLNGATLDDQHIAWESDIDHQFGDVAPTNFNTISSLRGGGTLNGTLKDEHFVVWMRAAALRNFRKLWGRINQDIPAGTNVTIQIQNRYNTYAFNGQKKVVLSTATWLGGANPFLGVAFLATGAASVAFGAAFALLALFTQYEMGDSSRLSWNENK